MNLDKLSPAGYYVALRVGFAFPVEEVNALPPQWVAHYTKQRFMLFDPVIRWVYSQTGVSRWSELSAVDPRDIMEQARAFGLNYGVAVSVFDGNAEGQRSFASFARNEREFTDKEIETLHHYVMQRHLEMAPPKNLTKAELDALSGVKQGKRLKQIAHELGISEGAVKQRLKSAKEKLRAKTSTQAATIAASYGLV